MQAYVNALLESYFFYEIKRFDIKGKAYLRTLGKYYIVDIGLRNCLLGFRNRDSGHAIENVVYFELLRRGYDVASGNFHRCKVSATTTKKSCCLLNRVLILPMTESNPRVSSIGCSANKHCIFRAKQKVFAVQVINFFSPEIWTPSDLKADTIEESKMDCFGCFHRENCF